MSTTKNVVFSEIKPKSPELQNFMKDEHDSILGKGETFISKDLEKSRSRPSVFYKHISEKAVIKDYKKFYTELVDSYSTESLETFQDLFKKLLLEDAHFIMPENLQKNEIFRNIINDYFNQNRKDIPILKPSLRICDDHHAKEVTALILSSELPNQKMISGSTDSSIRIWKLNTIGKSFKLLKILWGHEKTITDLQINEHCTKLFSASEDTTIRIWEFKNFDLTGICETIGILRGHKNDIIALCLTKSEKYLVSSCSEKKLIFWDIEKKVINKSFEDPESSFNSIACTSEKIFACNSSVIKIWDNDCNQCKQILNNDKRQTEIFAISINQKFKMLLSAGFDNKVVIWNLVTFSFIKTIAEHFSNPTKLLIIPNTKKFICIDRSQNIRLWDIDNPIVVPETIPDEYSDRGSPIVIHEESNTFFKFYYYDDDGGGFLSFNVNTLKCEKYHQPPYYQNRNKNEKKFVNFSADSKYLFWAENQIIKIWNLSKNKFEELSDQNKKSEFPIDSLVGSNDGKKLASGYSDQTISIWNFLSRKKICDINEENGYKPPLIFSENSTRLAYNTNNNKIFVWDISKKETLTITYDIKKENKINCFSLSDTYFGEKIIIGCDSGLFIKNCENKNEKDSFYLKPIQKIINLASHRDEVYTVSDEIVIWNAQKFEKRKTIKFENEYLQFADLTEEFIIYGPTSNSHIKLIDYDENLLGMFNMHSNYDEVLSLSFSRDGKKIVSNNQDHNIDVWILNKHEHYAYFAHQKNIKKIIVHDSKVISIDYGRNIKIWDFNTNELIDSLSLNSYNLNPNISNIKFTKDAKKIFMLSDGEMIIFEIEERNKITIKPPEFLVKCFTIFNKDPNKIVMTHENNIKIWDIKTESVIQPPKIISCTSIQKCFLAPNDNKMILSDDKNNLIIFTLKTNKEIKIPGENEKPIFILEFTSDSKKFITVIQKLSLNIYDFETGEKKILEISEPIYDLIVTPDQNILYSSTENRISKVNINNLNKIETKKIENQNLSITALGMYFKSNKIIFGDEMGGMNSMDLGNPNSQKNFFDYDGKFQLTSIELSPDSTKIIGDCGPLIIIWDIKTRLIIGKIQSFGYFYYITSDSRIFIKKSNCEIILWNLKTIEKIDEYKLFDIPDSDINITVLITDDNNKNLIFAGCSDGKIRVYDITNKNNILDRERNTELSKPVKYIKVIEELGLMITGNIDEIVHLRNYQINHHYSKIIFWASDRNFKKIWYEGKSENFYSQIFYSDQSKRLIVGTMKGKLEIYNLDKELIDVEFSLIQREQTEIISINEIFEFNKIITIDIIGNCYIWHSKYQVLCSIIYSNDRSNSKFISFKNINHLLMNNNYIYDVKNEIILNERRDYREEVMNFFLDENNDVILFNRYEGIKHFSFSQFLSIYQNMSSLKSEMLKSSNKFEQIAQNGKMMIPFKFNFLHILAIFEGIDQIEFRKYVDENWISIYQIKIKLNHFLHLDFRDKTPLDILLESQNKTLLQFYMNMIFDNIKNDPELEFYQKVKFFTYDFNYDQKGSFIDVIRQIIDLFKEETDILNKIFNHSFITLDSKNICHELNNIELNEPIFMTTNGFGWLLDKDIVNTAIQKLATKKDKKRSAIKCSVILLKGITRISDINSKLWSEILKLDTSNTIYGNNILEILIHYKWDSYAKRYYFTDGIIYLIFFLIYATNFIYLFPNRISNDDDNKSYIGASIALDILDIIYFLYYSYLEFKQIKYRRLQYFTEFWNYIDILIIFGVYASIILDFIYMAQSNNSFPLKIIVAITFIGLWLRVLSYIRGFQGTGFLIRLVLQTVIDIRYFLIIIFLLLLGFGSAAFMFQSNFSFGPFFVFNLVYRLILGDYTNYDTYDQAYGDSTALWIGMILFTVLLSIIMLNLLISIIGNTFNKVLETERSMRNIELLSVIMEIEKNRISERKIAEFEKNGIIGDYLICFHNDNHFKFEESNQNKLNKRMDLLEDQIKKINSEMFKKYEENEQKIKKMVEDNQQEIKKINEENIKEMMKKFDEQFKSLSAIVTNSVKKLEI